MKKIEGKVTADTVIEGVGAEEVWKVYGGLELGKAVPKLMPLLIASVEFLQGDGHGGVGTVAKVNFQPDIPGVGYLKEVFTKVDDVNRVKETEVIEGGFRAMGVDLYRVRLKIIGTGDDESTIVRSTIEYEMDEKYADVAPLITTDQFEQMAQAVGKYLNDQNNNKSSSS